MRLVDLYYIGWGILQVVENVCEHFIRYLFYIQCALTFFSLRTVIQLNWHCLSVRSLSREHNDTLTGRATYPMLHRSQQGDAFQPCSTTHLSASTLRSVLPQIMTWQCFLSSAISVVIWFLAMSSFTRSRHLSFGLPRFRFPSTVICNIFLVASSSLSHLWTHPNRLNLFSLKNSAIGHMCASFQMSTFLTWSSHAFPLSDRSMRYRHWPRAICNNNVETRFRQVCVCRLNNFNCSKSLWDFIWTGWVRNICWRCGRYPQFTKLL